MKKRKNFLVILMVFVIFGGSIACNNTVDCVHNWSDWTIHKYATCDDSGQKSRKCTKCSCVENAVINACGHAWDEGKKTVTSTSCGEMGVIKHTCKTCNKTKMAQIIGVHTYGDWTYEEYTYTIDHGALGIETVPSHRKVHSCVNCGFKEYASVEKHPCSAEVKTLEESIIKEPTGGIPGIKRRKCTICGWYQDFET